MKRFDSQTLLLLRSDSGKIVCFFNHGFANVVFINAWNCESSLHQCMNRHINDKQMYRDDIKIERKIERGS